MKRLVLIVAILLIAMNICFAGDVKPLYEVDLITLEKIRVEEQDILSEQEVAGVTQSYIGSVVSYEDLEQIRHRLTLLIIDKGYINSGMVIPDQDVTDGTVVFRVVTGSLTRIEIDGNDHFSTAWLESKLRRGTDGPLNIYPLQENLQLLQFDRSVHRINAELKAGDALGESILVAKVEEKSPVWASLRFSNNGSPSTGAYRGDLAVSYTNLIGRGDRLEGTLGLTEGDTDYSMRAILPLNTHDTSLDVYYFKSDSTVIEEAFDDLDIESDSKTFGVKLAQPFYLSLNHQLTLALAGERRKDVTTLLGSKYSFSPGVDNGEAKITVLRVSQEYVYRSTSHLFALASSFNFGIDAFNPTIHEDGFADGEFFAWLGQLRYIHQFAKAQLVTRIDAQLTDDRLLPMEKFSIGGAYSVRGYRKDFLVRDNGLSGTIEARLPIYGETNATGLTFIPFYDFGYAKDSSPHAGDGEFIDSVGAGFRWIPVPNLSAEFFYGYSFKDSDIFDDSDPQDSGIHFALSWEMP